jgi:phosphoribosylamine--glycine ligase
VELAKKNSIDLVVVAPDDQLAAGLVDDLSAAGIKAFGPTKAASQIEWSKAFAKKLMKDARIPTARYESFTDYTKAQQYLAKQQMPIVIKASGLALGKGVVIAQTKQEADQALKEIMIDKIHGEAGSTVVIEEFLEGQEVSFHAFCDGKTAVLFPTSQDHKQIFDKDRGPNTGGMGTIAPVQWVDEKLFKEVETLVVKPLINTLQKQKIPFAGVLYPGIIVTKHGPKVLEFNARFGDPETQSYMRLLETDLLDIFEACIDGTLKDLRIQWSKQSACCIVIASKGYPATSQKGIEIQGIDTAQKDKDIVVFHAGTKKVDDAFVTNGGRVLGVTAIGKNLNDSLKKAYAAVEKIKFNGMQYRRDIGKRKPPVFKKF